MEKNLYDLVGETNDHLKRISYHLDVLFYVALIILIGQIAGC